MRGGVCVASSERLYWLERGVVNSQLYCPKSSVEVPCVGVLCVQASGFEILLSEGGDVELGARTSKQIMLFALDPLTLNSLTLFVLCIIHIYLLVLCLASFILLVSSLYAWLVFVCLTYT